MIIRLLTGPRKGTVLEVPPEVARAWIERGEAEPVKTEARPPLSVRTTA